VVRAEAARAVGSVKVGQSWHGIGTDGSLIGLIDEPVRPVLEGFSAPSDRRLGLAASVRVREATGARVVETRRITPRDFRMELENPDHGSVVVIHVRPEATPAEQGWCTAFAGGAIAQTWADLRWTDRMVIGGGR
jgi:hypothetical protein